ncbi:glycosyltransferase [Candidatus Micrarchaeota archaeon]|nr:glycosyltransferase [Candidatus Micrarchaeota archaeon]
MDVSIIVCTLNEEKRIGSCLKSINKQKFSGSFEVIVADGNSEDKTVEIAKSLGAKTIIEKVRRISAERDAGAKIAQGKYFLFTDADAVVPENWVQENFDFFEKQPEVVGQYGLVFFSDVNAFEKKTSKIIMPLFMDLMGAIGMHNPIGSNISAKKNAFRKINGFDSSFVTCEDLDLFRRLKKTGKIKLNPKSFVEVSARRVKAWGYLYYIFFHLKNAVNFYFFNKASRKYENIR